MAKLEDSINVQALLSAESNIDTTLHVSVLHVLSRSPCKSKMSSIEQTSPAHSAAAKFVQPNVYTKLEYRLPKHQNRSEEIFNSHF